MKLPSDYKQEIVRLENQINFLDRELERSKQEYKEKEELFDNVRQRAKHLEYKIKDYLKEIEDLKNAINEKDEELSEYIRCNGNLLRINKERENAKRGLYPKKEHSGYLLLSSNPIDYKFYLHGTHKIVKIYQHVFQTPYNLDFEYYDAYDSILHDITHKDNNGFFILKELGCKRYNSTKRYEELLDDEIEALRRERYRELLERYKKENDCCSVGDNKEHELHEQAYTEELYYFFNMDIRMNGKEGYWELVMQSTCPLPPIPKELRFKKGNNDGAKDKNV